MGVLDYLCKDDNQVAYDVIQEEYGYIMQLAGLYPNMQTKKWRRISVAYFFLNVTVQVYMMVLYLVTSIKIIEDSVIFMQSVHYAVLFFIGLLCILPVNINRSTIATLYLSIGESMSNYDQVIKDTKETMKVAMRRRLKAFNIFVVSSIASSVAIIVIIGPLTDYYLGLTPNEIYSSGGVSLNTQIPTWTPIGTHHVLGLLMVSIIQSTAHLNLGIIILGSNILLMGSVEMLKLELDLLKHSLDELPNRAIRELRKHYGKKQFDLTKVSEQEMGRTYAFLLKQNAMHHIEIIRCSAKLGKAASVSLFAGYFVGGLIIAFSAIAILSGTDRYTPILSSVSLCILEILNMYYFSMCGDRLYEASDRLRLTLYSTKWRTLRKQESIYIKVMMTMAQKAITLVGCGLIPANFRSFSEVMNTAYSYFNLIYARRLDNDV